jgi:microcystin-dependent protein
MSDPYIGEIRMFGGTFAPVGWQLCQGQLLPISQYDALFTLIGTTYGGDGQNTFALPNLSSRLPVHQGPGYVLGQAAGAESVTLSSGQLPGHTHVPAGSSQPASTTDPANAVWANWSDKAYSTATPSDTMTSLPVQGGSQPHDNMSPFLAVNFIIATEGIFPPQN